MSAAELLAECRARGIHLAARDGQLLFDAPAGQFTAAIHDALAAHKEEVRRLLISDQIDQQLNELVSRPDESGRPCWIRQDDIGPDGRGEVGMLGLVSWVLNRKPAPPAEPPLPPNAPRDECLALAKKWGWLALEIRPGERVSAGEAAWRLFAERAFAPDVFTAVEKLRSSPPKEARGYPGRRRLRAGLGTQIKTASPYCGADTATT
jgi:hypothetical protein